MQSTSTDVSCPHKKLRNKEFRKFDHWISVILIYYCYLSPLLLLGSKFKQLQVPVEECSCSTEGFISKNRKIMRSVNDKGQDRNDLLLDSINGCSAVCQNLHQTFSLNSFRRKRKSDAIMSLQSI